jgi:hypothetical protein
MEKISRSVRRAKQGKKKWDADWAVRTVVRMLTWHDGMTHTWQSTWQVTWKSLIG